MLTIHPWLRSYNYIEDFFRTVYEMYSKHYVPSYPVTYYSTDLEGSVWDTEQLNAGAYEKGGVGELSGIKWAKIQLLPVWGVQTIQMNQESSEKGGLTFRDSATTQIIIPSLYGLLPVEGDVVDLSFGYKEPLKNVKMLYTVNNINLAHQGDYFQIYQLQLKMAPFTLDELEKQISGQYMFYDHDKLILPLYNTRRLLRLQDMSVNLTNRVNSLYNKQIGFYLGE